MKRKEFVIVNFALVGIVLFFSVLTINLSANQSLFAVAKEKLSSSHEDKGTMDGQDKNCSKRKPLTLPQNTNDPQLKKLGEYQQVCASFATDKMMFFTSFVENPTDAQEKADFVAKKLNTFKQAGVTPIVIAEPYVGDHPMEYKDFLAGKYDDATDQFFANLKKAGVTDQMMGTWVPFPESNTPNWANKNTEPRDFALGVNRYLTKLKKYFPQTKGSVLLNAATFEPNDLAWDNGNYLDLTPYLQDIDKNLVSSIGIQGFPWVSRADSQRREIFRASEFLQPDLLIAAAQELRTRDIWLNTGSFASKYTTNSKQTVDISLNERRAILTGILEEAKKLQTYQQNEYRVSINIFAEDKSKANEATDWSYFQSDDNKIIFKEFMNKAEELRLPVSLFDQAH